MSKLLQHCSVGLPEAFAKPTGTSVEPSKARTLELIRSVASIALRRLRFRSNERIDGGSAHVLLSGLC